MSPTEEDPGVSESNYELTSSVRDYQVPEWVKHVVWYQIFPERFRNGDPSNDPTRKRVGGPKGWRISPWTGDWYERADWERSMGKTFRSGVFHRRYGGDLQGIINKLDYLQDLGIGAIYLNPIFDAVSLHKYDTSYYHHVDRFFGPDPEGDASIIEQENPADPSTWQWTSADRLFLKLIEEVHNRDMKIIIDGVFNHTGTDFWAFRDVKKNQKKSPFKDWYAIKSFHDPETPKSEFDYSGWWGFKGLPEFKETHQNLVEPVRKHIFDITRRWMDPNQDGDPSDGVDGWRLDVPEEVGKEFWKEWCSLVHRINPEAYTVGEIWTIKSQEWVRPGLFHASMNYPFMDAIQEFMINQSITAEEFLAQLNEIREGFPDGAEYVMQNLVDSHDTPRIGSMVVNPGRPFDDEGKPEDGFDVRKPNVDERRVQKLISLIQFTYIGTPLIYYGTEAGMWGANDPDDRKPMLWEEYDYAPETHHPLGKIRPLDENSFDAKIFEWYRKLAHIRNSFKVFHNGDFRQLMVKSEKKLFVFARFIDKNEFAIVAVNRSVRSQKIQVPLEQFTIREGMHLKNLITKTRIDVTKRQAMITLPPLSAAILVPEESRHED